MDEPRLPPKRAYTADEIMKAYPEFFQQSRTIGNEPNIIKDEAKTGNSFFQSIANSFKGGVEQAKAGYSQAKNAKNPLELLEGGTKLAAGAIGAATSPLAPVFKPVEKAVDFVADKISDNTAVQDFAGSKAGETTSRVVEDVANLNTIAGAVAGVKGGAKVIENAPQAFKTVENLANTVKANANQYPKTLVDNISNKLTKIEPQVKNVLETTSIEKFNNYVKIGEEAKNNPRTLTPIEQVGERIDRQVLPNIKEDLNKIGSQKAQTLQSVEKTRMPNSAVDIIDSVRKDTLALKLTKDERTLVDSVVSELNKLGKNPTLGSADKTVDLLQATLYEKSKGLAIPTTSRVEGIVNQAIGKLNNAVKESSKKALGSDEYVTLNDAYAQRVQLFNQLNKAIGEDAGKSGGFVNKLFSKTSSASTKKTFAEIKELYGVDLAEDATLANFIMEALDDPRAFKLSEISTSKAGLLASGVRRLERFFDQPIKKARSIISGRKEE